MKKVLSIALAVAIVMSMSVVATAATGKIIGLSSVDEATFTAHFNGSLTGMTLRQGDVIEIPLTADMFEWDPAQTPTATEAVTSSQLSKGKITVRQTRVKGGDIFETVKIEDKVFSGISSSRTAYIKLEAKEVLTSVKDKDFELEIRINDGNNSNTYATIYIDGTLEPSVYEIDDADEIDMSYGDVVEATNNAKGVRAYIGEGVYLHTNFIKGTKYYGNAKADYPADKFTREQEKEYGIEMALTLNWLGFREGSTTVEIEGYGDTGYVYDANLNYLGTTKERLPLLKYYVLGTKRVETKVVTPEPVPEVPQETPPTLTPNDGASSGNSNYNVNTGR